jgi:hypothetical protein
MLWRKKYHFGLLSVFRKFLATFPMRGSWTVKRLFDIPSNFHILALIRAAVDIDLFPCFLYIPLKLFKILFELRAWIDIDISVSQLHRLLTDLFCFVSNIFFYRGISLDFFSTNIYALVKYCTCNVQYKFYNILPLINAFS